MNIRSRLKVSNLLMIVVPVVVAALVGASAMAVVWNGLARAGGIGVDSAEDFYRASDMIAVVAEPLVATGDFASLADARQLADMLSTSAMTMAAVKDRTVVYASSPLSSQDKALVLAAAQMEGAIELAQDGRCLTVRTMAGDGGPYRVCFLGDARAGSEALTKGAVVAAALVLLACLVLTVALLNRFLTLFVLRHITGPLDQLADATRHVRDGNLSYRLPEGRSDEFAPVFSDFNAMAARLRESVERDRRAREKRSILLVGLSHDLRSPLTSIQAYTEGLIDGVASAPADTERYLAMIALKAREMRALLQRLSDMAKVDRRIEEAPLEPARLDAVVRRWVDESRAAYDLRGLAVETRLSPATANISPELIGRVLGNLLDNCAAYGRSGEAPCQVIVSCHADAAGAAVLAVEDDGPGVPDEEKEKLFDLFFRGDGARSAPAEGSGIGLAVVALAAERMGGAVRAEASAEGGLRVVLVFPPCALFSGEGKE